MAKSKKSKGKTAHQRKFGACAKAAWKKHPDVKSKARGKFMSACLAK